MCKDTKKDSTQKRPLTTVFQDSQHNFTQKKQQKKQNNKGIASYINMPGLPEKLFTTKGFLQQYFTTPSKTPHKQTNKQTKIQTYKQTNNKYAWLLTSVCQDYQ